MSPRPYLLVTGLALLAVATVALSGCPKADVKGPAVVVPAPPEAPAGNPDAGLPPVDPLGSASNPAGGNIPSGPTGGLTAGTEPPGGAPPAAGPRVHTLARGETLYRLAVMYYGSGNSANVQKIRDANPKYPDERKIPAGAQIVVP